MSQRRRRLCETVQMKVAVLEKQKQDVLEIINGVTEEVFLSAQKFVKEEDGAHSFSELVKRLDKTSEILSKIGMTLDDIVEDVDEAAVDDAVTSVTAKDPEASQTSVSGKDPQESTEKVPNISFNSETHNNSQQISLEAGEKPTVHERKSSSLESKDVKDDSSPTICSDSLPLSKSNEASPCLPNEVFTQATSLSVEQSEPVKTSVGNRGPTPTLQTRAESTTPPIPMLNPVYVATKFQDTSRLMSNTFTAPHPFHSHQASNSPVYTSMPDMSPFMDINHSNILRQDQYSNPYQNQGQYYFPYNAPPPGQVNFTVPPPIPSPLYRPPVAQVPLIQCQGTLPMNLFNANMLTGRPVFSSNPVLPTVQYPSITNSDLGHIVPHSYTDDKSQRSVLYRPSSTKIGQPIFQSQQGSSEYSMIMSQNLSNQAYVQNNGKSGFSDGLMVTELLDSPVIEESNVNTNRCKSESPPPSPVVTSATRDIYKEDDTIKQNLQKSSGNSPSKLGPVEDEIKKELCSDSLHVPSSDSHPSLSSRPFPLMLPHRRGASKKAFGAPGKSLDDLIKQAKKSIAEKGIQGTQSSNTSSSMKQPQLSSSTMDRANLNLPLRRPNTSCTSPASSQLSTKETPIQKKAVTVSQALRPARLKKDEILAVSVTEIEDPWSFYILCGQSVETIAQKIQDLSQTGLSQLDNPVTGGLCLARYSDGALYRAKILPNQVSQRSEIRVFYCDFGNTFSVPRQDLYSLPEELLDFSCQSALCALTGVFPLNAEALWTEEAILQFREFVFNQPVKIRVVKPQATSQPQHHDSGLKHEALIPNIVDIIVEVPVTHRYNPKSGKTPEQVSKLLINKGLAKEASLQDVLDALHDSHVKEFVSKTLLPSPDIFVQRNKQARHCESPRSDHGSGPQDQEKRSEKSQVEKQDNEIFVNLNRTAPGGSNTLERNTSENSCASEEEEITVVDNLLLCSTSRGLDVEVNIKLHQLGQCLKRGLRKMNHKKSESICDPDSSEDESDSVEDDLIRKRADSPSSSPTSPTENNELEFQVMMSKVISPSSFFVHVVSEDSGRTLDGLMRTLNKTFKSYSPKQLAQISSEFKCERHRLCCAQFSEDNGFYRGLVLDIDQAEQPQKVLVLFIDYGDFEWVPISRIYPLPDKLKSVCPTVLWCSLLYVYPLDPDIHNHEGVPAFDWPESTVQTFKAMVAGEKSILAVATEKALQRVMNTTGFQMEPLPVYLLDKQNKEKVCLNFELIQKGLAQVKPTEYRTIEDEEDRESLIANAMADDFHSLRNTYRVNVDDAGVALVGYEAGNVGKEGRKVCVYYNRPRGCFRGERCPHLHIKVDRDGQTHDQVPVKLFDEDQSDILPEINTLVVMSVATVITPSNFFVTMPWKKLTLTQIHGDHEAVELLHQEESLEGLMENMRKFYYKSRYDGDMILLAPGQAMAAKVFNIWHRVKVISTDEENGKVQVWCVDFGNEEWVPEGDMRELDKRFLHLTPQAVQCHLVGVASAEEQWSHEACQTFSQLVCGNSVVAYVKERSLSGLIGVELYKSRETGDMNVGDHLVSLGLARKCADNQKRTDDTKRETMEENVDEVEEGWAVEPA